ncbi:protein phosphatase 1B [Drosophila serrata]|uniref:protein phosphatase 1B n=1 Tax=Drosophila serrata TaxID=7274 RepID=UPI000A1D2A3B|nr:protein phosphatase 1B [Drosophila serrata]
MGSYAAKPETEKDVHVGEGNGLRYCVSSMQGWRTEMEDKHIAACGLRKPYEDLSFFGVFDGHAGDHIAIHCAENLLTTITNTDQFSKAEFKEALREGYIQLDAQMRKMKWDKPGATTAMTAGGTTATCVLVTPKKMYLVNCGDSRAVLCRKGKASISTVDHRPTSPKEKARIKKAGGTVIIDRVNGNLAVSRALGDFQYKRIHWQPCEQMVSPEPDIFECDRVVCDEFVVIACDGIWDVMSSQEVCAYIHSRLLVTDDLPEIVNSILDICLHKDSRDNMTLMLLLLPGAPKISEDAVTADRILDHKIEELTRELIEKNDIYFFHNLLVLMDRKAGEIENLPPGGGLYAKYHVIRRVFHEMFPKMPADLDYTYY